METDYMFSAAPIRRTAEEEVERQGYHIVQSQPAEGSTFASADRYEDDMSIGGWDIEVVVAG